MKELKITFLTPPHLSLYISISLMYPSLLSSAELNFHFFMWQLIKLCKDHFSNNRQMSLSFSLPVFVLYAWKHEAVGCGVQV